MQLLKAFFLDLRARQGAVESNLVTLRQLESLVRLCEARARMDLRELATVVRPADLSKKTGCQLQTPVKPELSSLAARGSGVKASTTAVTATPQSQQSVAEWGPGEHQSSHSGVS